MTDAPADARPMDTAPHDGTEVEVWYEGALYDEAGPLLDAAGEHVETEGKWIIAWSDGGQWGDDIWWESVECDGGLQSEFGGWRPVETQEAP